MLLFERLVANGNRQEIAGSIKPFAKHSVYNWGKFVTICFSFDLAKLILFLLSGYNAHTIVRLRDRQERAV